MAGASDAALPAPEPATDPAFERLYREHYRSVRAYAVVAVHFSDVDDVVSETFLIAWRRRGDIPEDWARGWLIGVTRNVVRSRRRSSRRATNFIDQLAFDRPVSPDAPHDVQLHAEQLTALRSALGRLKASDQELLVFAGPYEMSHDEIALALDITVNAVGVRIHRARQRLRDAFETVSGGGEAA